MFTSEQIDHIVGQMAVKAEEYSRKEILNKMSAEAKADLDANPDLKLKLDTLAQDAFLEGVAQTMMYVGAIFQRKANKEDDA
jgi:hypothetical protein